MAGETVVGATGFAIEVFVDGRWIVCERDGEIALFETVADAETEARWSHGADITWRVRRHDEVA